MDFVRALIFSLAALFWAAPAHAVIPASQGYTYSLVGMGGGYPSLESWAAAYGPPRSFAFTGCTGVWNNNTSHCNFTYNGTPITPQQVQRYPAGLVCPSNSTLSGSNCNCNSGYLEDGGACVVPPEEAHCQSINGSPVKTSWPSTSMALTQNKSVCQTVGSYSCATTVETTMCAEGANGAITCYGSGSVTGGACTPAPEPAAPVAPNDPATDWPSAPPPGMCPGEINGVTGNVPCSTTATKTTSTTNSNDGQGTQTGKTETKSTTCTAAGTCTTTTTTTTAVNGGTPTTSTSTTTQPKGTFCASNKGSTECGDGTGSSFGGSCQASFNCTGDAVQCATAKAVNDQLCKFKEFFEMDGATQSLVESVVNGTWVKNPKDEPRQVNIGNFDQSNPLGDACPGDVAYSVMGVSMVLPLSQYCPQLRLMGNLLVAFTLLAATVFVVRGGTA